MFCRLECLRGRSKTLTGRLLASYGFSELAMEGVFHILRKPFYTSRPNSTWKSSVNFQSVIIPFKVSLVNSQGYCVEHYA
jgi:hypothetical protein